MARLESIAVGGYYKTPTHLLPRIACLFEPDFDGDKLALMDPCAGDGEAALYLAKKWSQEYTRAHFLGCEMESQRYKDLEENYRKFQEGNWVPTNSIVHADAFTLRLDYAAEASVLFLNPPYDYDPDYKRLEHRFLVRFTQALNTRGALVFVVPYYALAASAEFLATHYEDVHCFKFPAGDFEVFKQVVLVASKTSEDLGVDSEIKAQILIWSEHPEQIPDLPNLRFKPLRRVPTVPSYRSTPSWRADKIDLLGLREKARPWQHTNRSGSLIPVHGVLPDLPIEEMLLRKYPVATPPRPAHIAAGIASGIFNGSRISSTTKGMPDLLVKGVFDQEWRTVERKQNKDGEVTGVVQVQQPRLIATVLDLETYKYHTLKSDSSTKASVEDLTVAGLLKHYSDSLMKVMEQQCPIMYDPRRDGGSVELAKTPRTLFKAQAHATKALVHLLGGPGKSLSDRRGKAAFLIGEIGSGKTTVSSSLAKTLGSKRTLVMCPPHLLQSWKDEVREVLPEARVKVLDSVTDIEEIHNDTSDDHIIAVLSRETAKLSHGWEGVGDVCPTCGGPTPKVDLAKKRVRCEHVEIRGSGPLEDVVIPLARKVAPYDPSYSAVTTLLTSRWDRKRLAIYEKRNQEATPLFPGLPVEYLDRALAALVLKHNGAYELKDLERAIIWALHAIGDEYRIARAAEYFLTLGARYYHGYYEFGSKLLYMLPPNGDSQKELIEKYGRPSGYGYGYYNESRRQEIINNLLTVGSKIGDIEASWKTGKLVLGRSKSRSLGAAKATLSLIAKLSDVEWSEPCGEILFQATTPRRVALAKHIQTRYPKLFDFMILDEAHEYSSKGSAQEVSAHRLTGLQIPYIKMTGSLMNGYADSLFMNMWSVSPEFREEFPRTATQRFVDRYGYRKRLVQEKDEFTKEVVEFGSQSDRVVRSERTIGNAPGILPLFLLRHLLPCSVTLHKTDLALELPHCEQETHHIEMSPEQHQRANYLQRSLVDQIKKDQFEPGLAGKLFGQLAELPSYLDRATADAGNTERGDYDICYPDSVGGGLVARQKPFDATEILPKEQWMLDTIRSELDAGRNVMVFAWHLTLLPRLARLIETELDTQAPILYANKVPTAKRQDWINKKVIKKGARVLVANPVAIQTGLNNLVHFCTEIWMENPACNPLTFRQAIGRVDRIGQKEITRILFPLYKGSLQESLHELLLQKVAVSVSTDGLDPESALLAAGIGTDEFFTGMSIGKQLWAMLSEGFTG